MAYTYNKLAVRIIKNLIVERERDKETQKEKKKNK